MEACKGEGCPPLLLTKAELMKWLKVSPMWVRMRLADDPAFVERCVVDIATPRSSRRKLRFSVDAVVTYLGIPAPRPHNARADHSL